MNRQEVNLLLKKISKEFNIPMPKYHFCPPKTIKIKNGKGLRLKQTFFHSSFLGLKDKTYHDLEICESSRGVNRIYVVHEFFHYLDWVNEVEPDEKSVRGRTRKWLKDEKQ